MRSFAAVRLFTSAGLRVACVSTPSGRVLSIEEPGTSGRKHGDVYVSVSGTRAELLELAARITAAVEGVA